MPRDCEHTGGIVGFCCFLGQLHKYSFPILCPEVHEHAWLSTRKFFSDLTWHLSSSFPSKASKTWLITLKDMTDPDLVLNADKKSELVWFTFLKESDIHILGKLYYQHL